MRVLHVCPYMDPAAGGPPVVVERYCHLSRNFGWQATLICTSLFTNDQGAELRRTLSQSLDVNVLTVDRSWLRGLSSLASESLRAGVCSADIVHLHTLWHPLGRKTHAICMQLGRPYVLMPHGMLDPHSLHMKQWRKRAYLHLVEKQVLNDASCIVYTTPEEQRLAVDQFLWLPRGAVSSLGADNPPDVPRRELQEAFLERFPSASGRRILLFLGRLHPKKGIERILHILPSLLGRYNDLLLVIAGTGDSIYIDKLQNEVRLKALAEHVLFAGQLQNALKWGAFACAQLFLLPSAQENFAISTAEALRFGVPVIITDRVNLWPYVAEANAGIVVPFQSVEVHLSKAVSSMLDNPSTAYEMGRRGAILAERKFSWHDATGRIIALYESVLASR